MLSVRHLAPKIFMAVNCRRHQLDQRLGLAEPDYHKKEGATPHYGALKHNMQYDRRPDVRFWVQFVM